MNIKHLKLKNAMKVSSLKKKESRLAYRFIFPTALIVFGLVVFPAVYSIWISFHDVGLKNLNDVYHAPFVGFENFKNVINDFAFKFQDWKNAGAIVTSIIYSLFSTILTVFFGLIAALLLNRPFKGRGIARSIFLFPYVAPVVSVAFVWRWILDPRQSGVINDVLMRLNLIDAPRAYLSTRGLALFLVIIFESWRYFPFAMLMILARLQAIDDMLYEAAEVDGANHWQKFIYITLPELKYVLGSSFLLRLIWTFNKFDDVFLLTGGGYGTKVLPILTYEFSFKTFNFGKGAATAMILFVIVVIFMILYSKIASKSED
ncbi:MAG: sugar ABC transporter permease [Chloroflexi bacterium]|nr:sugar ABC transporter permease [Chloroflexota bacterium]